MGRTIAVSGAASGIGRALTEILRDAGETVIGIDLHRTEVCADLSVPDGRARAVEQTLEKAGGRLDAVVACAGVSDFTVMPVKVNFFGAVGLLEGLRPLLAEAEAPRAAVVASISGTHPVDGAVVRACLDRDEPAALAAAARVEESGAGGLLYPSSKSALAQWLRRACTAPEWAGAGIALNAIAPGVVRTPMTRPLFEDAAMLEIMNEAVPMPLNGHAEPEVIAEALRWLVSPVNSHMTGQVIYVDGGAEATLRDPSRF
jgi:NAD(P)-dependent dehydrogenase (short-subunit alcohol dehydrogenase family)